MISNKHFVKRLHFLSAKLYWCKWERFSSTVIKMVCENKSDFNGGGEQYNICINFSSTPHTRDERWSTLREILPSGGTAVRANPPDWGSRASTAPKMSGLPQKRFPIIQSPMSRSV